MCDILIFSPFIDDWLLYHFLPFTFSLNFFILEGGKPFSHLIFTFSIISNFCCHVAKVNFLSFYFHIFTYTYTHFFSLFGQVANFPFLSFHFYIFFCQVANFHFLSFHVFYIYFVRWQTSRMLSCSSLVSPFSR